MTEGGSKPKGLGPGRSIEVVINPAAGRAGPEALAKMQAIFAEAGEHANIVAAEPADIETSLKAALARKPDLLVVLAGDGTARAAAAMCGVDGPLIAPLPGGTMNMLPKALYGEADWEEALKDTLDRGVERKVGGGVIGGHSFYVAAMLGSTALFAPAREAARHHRLAQAMTEARDAYRRAFKGRTRFTLDGGEARKAQALTLICPLISKVMDDEERWMEAAAINPSNVGEAMRIGARVVLSPVIGDWRNDKAVETWRCRKGRIWTRTHSIPALLDGEPVTFDRSVEFHFNSCAFRALAPEPEASDQI